MELLKTRLCGLILGNWCDFFDDSHGDLFLAVFDVYSIQCWAIVSYETWLWKGFCLGQCHCICMALIAIF